MFSIVIVEQNSSLARKRSGNRLCRLPGRPPTRIRVSNNPLSNTYQPFLDPNHDYGRSRPTPSKSKIVQTTHVTSLPVFLTGPHRTFFLFKTERV